MLTLAFQRHQGTKKPRGCAVCSRQLWVLLSHELGQLSPRQVDEPGDVADNQLREHLRFFMAQLFHKEVGIEDNGLTAKGGLIADDKIADGITGKKGERENKVPSHCFFTASWCPKEDIC